MWGYFGIGGFSLAGAGFLLYVAKRLIETVVFRRSAARTEGTVIYLADARSSDGHLTYLPVFEYRTGDGSVYRYTATVASNPPAYNVGDAATILFLRKNPNRAKLDSFSEMWLTPLILSLIGLLCWVFAFLIFRYQ